MKMILAMTTMLLLTVAVTANSADTKGTPLIWHDASRLTVEGRGWNDAEGFYDRFPARAKSVVNEGVWFLQNDSTGMVVRFVSDTPEISVRWKLDKPTLALYHMPSTGVSGVDLYVRMHGKWSWLAMGKPLAQENEEALINGMSKEKREFALYLPLYNGVSSVEIGIPEDAAITPAPARTLDVKPVVFYGTSITQGGCASRPGMAYPSIIGRKLDIPTINLGFSGNGRCEHEVADLLAELDPSVYVIDPLANMTADSVEERIGYLLKTLRAKHPDTPVILVEHPIFTFAFNRELGRKSSAPWNDPLKKVYKKNAPEWNGKLYYAKCDNLLGQDGEGTVDGVHATDLGFSRMAEALLPIVKKALFSKTE